MGHEAKTVEGREGFGGGVSGEFAEGEASGGSE
jgi:hypothetical protein